MEPNTTLMDIYIFVIHFGSVDWIKKIFIPTQNIIALHSATVGGEKCINL